MRALGTRADELHLVGGASKSRAWARVLADVLGLRVRPLAEPESAALGAALLAAWAVGRAAGGTGDLDRLARGFLETAESPVEPDRAAHAALVPLAARFREIVAQSFG